MRARPVPLSIIIPTYNERENIPPLLERVRRALDGIGYEIIFVDDSTDGTDEVITAEAARGGAIRLVHRERDRGLATAVTEGFRHARGEVLGVLDADLQHPPELLPVLLAALEAEEADIAVATRFRHTAHQAGLGLARKAIARGTRMAARLLLGSARRTSDPLSGFFLIRRRVVEGRELRPMGFKILLEVLARGEYRRVVDVPYRFDPRHAGTTKASLQEGLSYLRHLAGLVAASPDDSRIWKFLIVGTSGVLVNMGIFALLARVLGIAQLQQADPSRRYLVVLAGLGAGVTSTFSNFLLNSVFTWADRPPGSLARGARRLMRYYTTTIVGTALYLMLLTALVWMGVPPLLANLGAVGSSGLVNFLLHNQWTWRSDRSGASRSATV